MCRIQWSNNLCIKVAFIMHNLVQKFPKKKCSSSIFLILLYFLQLQYSFSQDDPTSTNQIIADSVFTTISEKDSLIQHSYYKIDSNHKSNAIFPYFRDSYRVILDMRKLVRMFNYQAVDGYESMNDLFNTCRKFPEYKQAKMIYMAMAGGAVNLLSVQTNRELSKRKINFLRWQIDKVSYRNNFKFLYVNLHTGLNSRGMVLSIPTLRIYYYRYLSSYYSTDGIIIMPLRKIGLNCSHYAGRTLITPFYTSSLGTIELTYDIKYKRMSSHIDLRKTSFFVVRVVHVKFFDHQHSDCLLSEVLIWW